MYYYFVKSKFKIKLYELLHCEHMSCNHCKLQSKQEEFVWTQLVLRENAKVLRENAKHKKIYICPPTLIFFHHYVPKRAL